MGFPANARTRRLRQNLILANEELKTQGLKPYSLKVGELDEAACQEKLDEIFKKHSGLEACVKRHHMTAVDLLELDEFGDIE